MRDEKTAKEVQGTGLGLYPVELCHGAGIAKGIVESVPWGNPVEPLRIHGAGFGGAGR